MTLDLGGLADPDAGWVSRRVYVDPGVYELELERVFARAWLYLGHVSQLREPGDYITTMMGEDPVIVVRGADGIVRAFLNSCRHRGMRVCRAEEGNTSFFRCPYHAWTYSNEGDLRGVPKYRRAYEGVMQREDFGLFPVAKLGEIHGLLFATWDPEAPELLEYLGGFAVYMDLIFGRDPKGIEIIPGTHRWTIEGNWKHAAENFACDMYHVSSAHQRTAELGMMNEVEDHGYEVSAGAGYCGNQFSRPIEDDFESEETIHSFWTMPNPVTEPLKERRRAMAERVGLEAARLIPIGHASIFPNFSILDVESMLLVRVQQPVGPNKMMVHQWGCVDASLDEFEKDAMRKQYVIAFGPAGLLEQDDGENWRECQQGMRGYVGRNLETNMRLGLGRDLDAREVIGGTVPGRGGGIWSEANQRHFYRHWLTYMASESSADVRTRLSEVSYG
ncbi:MAG TPA: SRPBCC family protein [Solirubrobacteraceae bacterium]|nr:SRPBCC family protein [Solirubrobacteraceae bacterium]